MNIKTLHNINLKAVKEVYGYEAHEIRGHEKKMQIFFCRIFLIQQLRSNSMSITAISRIMNRTKSGIIYSLKEYPFCKLYSLRFRTLEEKLLINQKIKIKEWRILKLKKRRNSIAARRL